MATENEMTSSQRKKGAIMKRQTIRSKILRAATPVLFSVALLQSCTSVSLISPYDEVTDGYLTALHAYVLGFIDTLEQQAGRDAAALTRHEQTYEGIERQITQLEFRVAAMPNNEVIVKLVHQIRLSVLGSGGPAQEGSSLRDLHSLNEHNRALGPSRAVLEVCRRNIDQTISAALALELYEKAGKTYNQ